MNNLIKNIAAKLNTTETEASQVMQEIRETLAEFVAKLKQEADAALDRAREVFEEVAGRGFPNHDFTAQSAKLREAEAAVSKANELGAAVANIVEPIPADAVVEPAVAPVVESVADAVVEPAVAPVVESVETVPAAPVEPAPQ